MTKNLAYSLLMVFGSSVLGACQMFDAVKGHPDSKSDVNQNTVQIYCSGAESCQFGRLDDLIVVNEKTQRINSDAVKRGWVKYTESTELNKQLYLYVPAKQHELVIRFYPISQQHAEVFHVIHRFKANQKYTFKMYRDRKQNSGSLLNVSAPPPLCVDLLQKTRVIRRFCRPYDVVTGVSEYIEQKI